jgi:hypothetical protein
LDSAHNQNVNHLLDDFAKLSSEDTAAFIRAMNRSNKISSLLSKYLVLNEDEAAQFIAGMNNFVFSSSIRKKVLRDNWQDARVVFVKKQLA